MKILHLVDSLDPRMGGLPRAVLGMALAQSESGHEVIVASTDQRPEAEALECGVAESKSIRSLSFLSVPPVRLQLRSASLEKSLSDLQPDWLQVHGLWEPVLHAAMRWARASSIPYGVTPHAMLHPWQCRHHRFSKWGVRKLLRVEALWSDAECLHALTAVEAATWETVPGCRERIHIIPNGIDPATDPGDSGKRIAGLPEGPFLLFLGRLSRQKNPESLLEAFSWIVGDFPDLHLVFAGPDYGLERFLRKEADAFDCSSRLHFTGPVAGQQKWDLLHQCTAFCLPSRGEGFSLAVLEAALAKAPCLISAECGFPELIEAGGGCLVSPHSETLAVQLKDFLGDLSAACEMGVQANLLIRQHYTWSQIAGRLNQMMESREQNH